MVRTRLLKRFVGAALVASAVPAIGGPQVDFAVAGGDKAVTSALQQASLVYAAQDEADSDPRDLLAAARADYGRLVNALYAEGYYGGVVRIEVDGREAASLSPFASPSRIGTIRVSVDPGPQFTFGTADVSPLAPGSVSPEAFRAGMAARSTVVREAAADAVSDWRDAGRAKAEVSGQRVVADHRNQTLNAEIRIAPGPLVRFGELVQKTPSAVRAERIQVIAGLPTGEVFSPAEAERAAERLRRTGAFSSVTLTEAATLGPGDTLDMGLEVADQKPHRFGFGAELQSLDGLTLSGFWMHRNLFGGAERLRVEAELTHIDFTLAGMDAAANARLDIPAAFGTDNDAFIVAEGGYFDQPGFEMFLGAAGVGVHRRFTPELEGELGLAYAYARFKTMFGSVDFSYASVPANLTWDRRDNALDPTSGTYVRAELEPLYEFNGSTLAARGYLDARAYFGLMDGDLVLAGRGQVGYVATSAGGTVPPDFLFYSGGGGSVRGFPFQSMGAGPGGDNTAGGQAFLGASAELRYKVSDTIGLVGFADVGHVGADSFLDNGNQWQVGAGAGVRYYTGMGPIRLDVAVPVSGPGATLSSVWDAQLYIGIGQSF